MALYPIKVLLDKDRNIFIPFLPADAIPINGSDETVAGALANRYTKAEVDAIIQGLGTLQVLCGRVATRADLDNIQNPKAGDTYIVGTDTTNNSEWMWIGDTWEELGPMIDLSAYYTKEEITNLLASYATVNYVNNLIDSRPTVEHETSLAMTGEELHLAILNKTLKNNVVVTCTKDYLNYKTGYIYLIKEEISGPRPITEQLEALGFVVNISSTLESNNDKYYYIAKLVDGTIYAAYSQVPLNTSGCSFPTSGWRTFSVAKKSTGDPKFYYNNGSDHAPNLSRAITGDPSSSLSRDWSVEFSTAVEATYSNDPEATAFTYYSSGEGELILTATDVTAGGKGVPSGGTTGQVLKKKSNNDYDTEWVNESGGSGGTSDYTNLNNKPKINNIELNGNKSLSDLGITNFSGDYNDLSNKPTIPTKTSDLTNDNGFLTNSIVELHGTDANPVDLNILEAGYYKIYGRYTIGTRTHGQDADKSTPVIVGDWGQYSSAIYKLIIRCSGSGSQMIEYYIIKHEADGKYYHINKQIQDQLVSGTNIKTINNQSILGEGNIDIASSGGTLVPKTVETNSDTDVYSCNYINNLVGNIEASLHNINSGSGV